MEPLKKLIGRILNIKGVGDGGFTSLTDGGRGTPLSSNMSDSQLLASNTNWVFTCVDKIATTVSGIELELYTSDTKGDKVEVEDHKILSLLRKPNNYQTGRDLIYMLIAHIKLTGNAYILLDQPLNPTQMAVLIPSGVKQVFSDDRTEVVSYKYQIGGKSFIYEAERVIHLKTPSITNPFKGSGVLANIASWVDVDSAATEFNRLFFVNGAAPSGILETEATTEQGLILAKRGFEMRYSGTNNAHKTAVLSKGSKYSASSATPHDMQFSEMDTRYRDKILAGFGVPKSIIGITEDVNRANADANIYVYMLFTIDPLMKWFCAYLNEWLLPKFTGTDKMCFEYDEIIPENEDLEIRENVAALAGQSYKTINEVREEEGLPPIENGDYIYGGFNTVPIGKPVAQTVENNLDNAQAKTITKGMQKTSRMASAHRKDSLVEKLAGKLDSIALKMAKAEMAELVHKEFIERTTPYEGKFIKSVKAFDDKVKQQVIDSITNGDKAFTTKELFNPTQATDLFIGLTMPILQELLKAEGAAQMDRLDTGTPFNPLNEAAQKRIKQLLGITAQSYTDTTLKLLNTQLQAGVEAGEGLTALVQRVSDVFALTDTYRASQVARTTVFGVANSAAREAYKQSGVVTEVAWHTAEDEKVCEYCGPMDGKVIGVDENFFDEGDTVNGSAGGKLPLNFMGIEDPPLHPSCRCFTNAETIAVQRAQDDGGTIKK